LGGRSESDFYSAFGPVTVGFDGAATPDADIKKETSSELRITVKAGVAPATTRYDFKINSIVNPFSQIANTVITVQHFVGCVTTGSAT
jgi:hypothetical protein